MTDQKIRWGRVAPLKSSKKKAIADLEYCITDPDDRAKHRVVRSTNYPSRWEIQYGRVID